MTLLSFGITWPSRTIAAILKYVTCSFGTPSYYTRNIASRAKSFERMQNTGSIRNCGISFLLFGLRSHLDFLAARASWHVDGAEDDSFAYGEQRQSIEDGLAQDRILLADAGFLIRDRWEARLVFRERSPRRPLLPGGGWRPGCRVSRGQGACPEAGSRFR